MLEKTSKEKEFNQEVQIKLLTREQLLKYKHQLEVLYGRKLTIETRKQIERVFMKCRNQCQFVVELRIITSAFHPDENEKAQSSNMIFKSELYEILKQTGMHDCELNHDEGQLIRIKKMLDDNKEKIRELLSICDERSKRSTPPKEVIKELAKELGTEPNFIYGTLEDENMKKRAKKKFDNLIQEIRRESEKAKLIIHLPSLY